MTKKETFKWIVQSDGDTDGDGDRILYRVLNKEEAFWSLIPGRFVTQPHSNLQLCKLNDGTNLTPDRQGNNNTISYLVNSWSQAIAKFGCYSIFYPKTGYHEILR